MSRSIVTAGKATGHPFRRQISARAELPPRGDDHDLKLFVLSFTAFFVCFYTFLM